MQDPPSRLADYRNRARRQARGCQETARATEPVKTSTVTQVVTNAAREHGLLYGLATALMAVATGLVRLGRGGIEGADTVSSARGW